MTCWSPSPAAASLLRIPCELVLDMGFVPALQDPGSPEHQELLQSFNQTVSAGWGRGLRAGTTALSPRTLCRSLPSSPRCPASCGWR